MIRIVPAEVTADRKLPNWRLWLKELGIKKIFIDPFCNYTAGLLGDKWIAPRVGTDAALALAIAYVWIKEDTYDKDYIAKRTTDFDKFKEYVLGKEDGIPKTPGLGGENHRCSSQNHYRPGQGMGCQEDCHRLRQQGCSRQAL